MTITGPWTVSTNQNFSSLICQSASWFIGHRQFSAYRRCPFHNFISQLMASRRIKKTPNNWNYSCAARVLPASNVPLASHSLIKVAPKLLLHSGVLKRVRSSILSHGRSGTAVPQTSPQVPPTLFNDPATCFDYCLVGWLDWCEMTIVRFIVVLNADTFPYWCYGGVKSRRWSRRGRR